MFIKIHRHKFIRLFLALALFTICLENQISAQSVQTLIPFPAEFNRDDFQPSDSIVVNPNLNRLYNINGNLVHGWGGVPGGEQYMNVFDTTDNNYIKSVPFPTNFSPFQFWGPYTYMAINPNTNRIYVFGYYGQPYTNGEPRIAVYDGNTDSFITTIQFPSDFSLNFDYGDDVYLTVNSATNRIYLIGEIGGVYGEGGGTTHLAVLDGNNNSLVGTFPFPTGFSPSRFVAVNPNINRIYVRGNFGSDAQYIAVFDGSNNSFITAIPLPLNLGLSGFITVNPTNNRLYIHSSLATNNGNEHHIALIDGNTNTFIKTFPFPSNLESLGGIISVNPNTNRLFIHCSDGERRQFAIIDGNNDVFLNSLPIPTDFDPSTYISVNPVTNKLYVRGFLHREVNDGRGSYIAAIDPGSSPVSTGSNVPVQADGATLTFNNITSPGTVTVTPIADPSIAGDIPGGFAISESLAFEISSTAAFTGSVTSCFSIPNVNNETEFLNLRVLHRELNPSTNQYALFDRTSSHDFPNRKICAQTTSFSPFYLAKVDNKVNALFNQNTAYNSGSTVPIKLQILDTANQNISSANLALTLRNLRNLDTNQTFAAQSSGNSNPDNAFKYSSNYYKYNLKTTGLPAGRYVLSFYAGTEHSFFHTVEFKVR